MITISTEDANQLARDARNRIAQRLHGGHLSEYAEGIERGILMAIEMYMPVDKVTMQGIWNEVNFFCRSAA